MAIYLGLVHSYLGERFILTRLFKRELPTLLGSDWFTKRILRFAWHLTTVAWWGFAAILFILSNPTADIQKQILMVISVVFLVSGLFPLDTKIEGNVSGYLLYVDGVPAGHTAIANEAPGCYEVCDFYVVPYFRKNKVGKRFISQVFNYLGGSWEIKQVAGAEHAVKFWGDVLSDYTSDNDIAGGYVEDSYDDEQWGVVTRQRFSHD